MGKWTLIDDNKIDKHIDNIINDVISETKIHLNPSALILSGSFGYGEGTVVKNRNGIEILSDLDMTIVVDQQVSRDKLHSLSSDLSIKHNCDITIGRTTPSNHINPSKNNPGWSNNPPSTNIYNRKYGAKVLYGIDYIDMIQQINPKNIRKVDAPRALFNRMGESLIHIKDIENKDKKISNKELFWLTKILISCMDSYLILNNSYHYSYKKKLSLFNSLFLEDSYFSSSEIKEFHRLINDAVIFKLYSEKENLKKEKLSNYRNRIQFCLDKFLRLTIDQVFDFKYNNYFDFKYKYLRSQAIYEWHRLPSKSVLVQNFYYNLQLRKKSFISPKNQGFLRLLPLPHIMYTIVLTSFFNNFNDNDLNKRYLDSSVIGLSNFLSRRNLKDSMISLNSLNEKIYRLWKILCI